MDLRTCARRDLRLDGERVALVPVEPGHAEALFPLVHGRDEVLRWLIWRGPETVDELAESYQEWRTANANGIGVHLAILDRTAGDAPVGTIGLRFLSPRVGDLGYWLASHVWGRGYCTEAVALVARLAFEHSDANALCAWVDVGNEASRRVLEKNGFVLEQTVRAKAAKPSGPTDQWGFVLTRRRAERLLDAESNAPRRDP